MRHTKRPVDVASYAQWLQDAARTAGQTLAARSRPPTSTTSIGEAVRLRRSERVRSCSRSSSVSATSSTRRAVFVREVLPDAAAGPNLPPRRAATMPAWPA